MSGKLRNYQVLDVLCGGTFYKVKHKVTHKIFAWRACDCSTCTDDRIKRISEDVALISKLESDSMLRYYETIMHAPSKTLYIVMEFNSERTLAQLVEECETSGRHVAEAFVWHVLRELAKVCKLVVPLQLCALACRLRTDNIFISESCQLTVDSFTLEEGNIDLIHAAGEVARSLINCSQDSYYSDDLHDVIGFLTDCHGKNLKPDVILYHPTVLAHLEPLVGQNKLSEILIHSKESNDLEINKCDSEKVVELCKAVKPLPRRHIDVPDSPIYCNISPKRRLSIDSTDSRASLSPTLAALALELPGFVPRSRKPISQALTTYKPQPQQISENTLSQQWLSRLVALRQREESLNKRERELIRKEIVNSPNTKFIPLRGSPEVPCETEEMTNGITLPSVVPGPEDKPRWVSRRRQRRSSSVRTRSQRKSLAYEDLDSSLSADPGDSSMIVTAAKITKENMPRRNIFPEISTKKVHFTPVNPFVESDESVTLTFYELENIDRDGYQVPRKEEKVLKDITKFKYLDLEKLTTEKRAAMQWAHSSPSKQPKYTKKTLCDITNDGVKRSPSKASLTSKGSNSSRYSMASSKSEWSMESAQSVPSKASGVSKASVSRGGVRESTRLTRQSMAAVPQTPAPEKKSKRKSLLPFKTPFKFMSSAKIV